MKRFLLILLLQPICTGLFAQRQSPSNIYLRDGSIIRGHIIEQYPNGSIKVRTSDGTQYTFTRRQVLNTVPTTQRSRFAQAFRRSPKFGGIAEIGYTTPNQLDLQFSLGVRFAPYLFAGGGIGIAAIPEGDCSFVPMFGHLRFSLPTWRELRPYFDIRGGWAFATDANYSGRLFANITTGLEIKHFSVGIGYSSLVETNQYDCIPSWEYTCSDNDIQGFTMRLGYTF